MNTAIDYVNRHAEDFKEQLKALLAIPSVSTMPEHQTDVERAAALGADAVLVGSALSASLDPVGAVRALCGVARRGRRAS